MFFTFLPHFFQVLVQQAEHELNRSQYHRALAYLDRAVKVKKLSRLGLQFCVITQFPSTPPPTTRPKDNWTKTNWTNWTKNVILGRDFTIDQMDQKIFPYVVWNTFFDSLTKQEFLDFKMNLLSFISLWRPCEISAKK
jgi:hypothetical protein